MPYYNFEVHKADQETTTEGVELPDCFAAKLEASNRIATLLADKPLEIWRDQDWELVVTNDVGLILYVMRLSAQKTAASMYEAV